MPWKRRMKEESCKYSQRLLHLYWMMKDKKQLSSEKHKKWTSWVVQWLRIRLPMQGLWVQSLVQEDPTFMATKSMCHNSWGHIVESISTTREAPAMRSLHTTTKSSHCSPQLEKALARLHRPSTAKNCPRTFQEEAANADSLRPGVCQWETDIFRKLQTVIVTVVECWD